MIKILTLIIIILSFFYFFFIRENFSSEKSELEIITKKDIKESEIKNAFGDKVSNLIIKTDLGGTTSSGTKSSGTTSSGTKSSGTTSSGTTSSGIEDKDNGGFTNYESFQNVDDKIIIRLSFDKITELKIDELVELLKLKFEHISEIHEIIGKVKKEKYNKEVNLLTDILTNNSCIDEPKQCNLAFRPYNELEFKNINPRTNNPFSHNEIVNIKTLFNNKCGTYKNSKHQACCNHDDKGVVIDDKYLNNLDDDEKGMIEETLEKYNHVDVSESNNTISSIKVCNKDDKNDCGDGSWKPPDVYELCKLINLDDDEKKTDIYTINSGLTRDCYTSFCNDDKYFTIDNKNMDEIKTNHYYLIEAVKRDDAKYLENYYKNGENKDAQLKYGYGGNTIFHHAVYYKSDNCIDYLLKFSNCKKHIVNKDLNNILHIACLNGTYTCVDKLLKCGFSIEHKNKYGDTVLHCAVRSGSYNCVKILLDYNGFSNILIKNKYGETPLHTSVIPLSHDSENDRLNYKIVEILVQYGAEIHTTNNLGDTILKTLMNKNKSLEREKIRTFLQRQYYMKYDKDEYSKMLNSHPEIRPFDLNTTLNDNFNKYSNNVDYKNIVEYSDDKLHNEDLYVNKDTYAIKDKLP